MAQAIQEFGPFTDRAWEIAKRTVREHFGVPLIAESDTVSQQGLTIQYTYDRAAQLLRVQLLKWPFFMPSTVVNERIHMLCENAVIQAEEELHHKG